MPGFDLSHLTQPPSQEVWGPVQDDEALLLFALVRVMRLRTVLEVGGQDGYSALNFLKAVGPEGTVFTCDVNPVPRLAPNHQVLTKDARLVTAEELGGAALELVFFDCHDYDAQMELFLTLRRCGPITDATVLALHDTNLHPRKLVPWAYPVCGEDAGFVHRADERRMVNDFRRMGYDALCLHTRMERHDASLPFRHGLTVMKKFTPLAV
jgi:predicted O-methyltransferase YrrM